MYRRLTEESDSDEETEEVGGEDGKVVEDGAERKRRRERSAIGDDAAMARRRQRRKEHSRGRSVDQRSEGIENEHAFEKEEEQEVRSAIGSSKRRAEKGKGCGLLGFHQTCLHSRSSQS